MRRRTHHGRTSRWLRNRRNRRSELHLIKQHLHARRIDEPHGDRFALVGHCRLVGAAYKIKLTWHRRRSPCGQHNESRRAVEIPELNRTVAVRRIGFVRAIADIHRERVVVARCEPRREHLLETARAIRIPRLHPVGRRRRHPAHRRRKCARIHIVPGVRPIRRPHRIVGKYRRQRTFETGIVDRQDRLRSGARQNGENEQSHRGDLSFERAR